MSRRGVLLVAGVMMLVVLALSGYAYMAAMADRLIIDDSCLAGPVGACTPDQ